MSLTEAIVSKVPNCDLCVTGHKQPAVVDARMYMGQWAYMCDSHWKLNAADYPKLGTGIGQRLILEGK